MALFKKSHRTYKIFVQNFLQIDILKNYKKYNILSK